MIYAVENSGYTNQDAARLENFALQSDKLLIKQEIEEISW
jgi:hypothetical protein